jgi:glycosyltransferase involved in cell wall biosynthesis
MRVLMLVPQAFYSARGTPLSAYHRAQDLAAMGHRVDVLTYPVGAPPPDFEGQVFRSGGPHFASHISQGPSYRKIWFDLLLLGSLLRRLSRDRYDMLYAHEEGAFLAALVGPLFRIPIVYDMHSSLPLQIRDWSFSDREWVVGVFRWIERFALRRARAVVAISPGVAEAARRAVPDLRVVTLLNRFTLGAEARPEDGRALRRELGLRDEDRVILYTGSFVPLQALDLLVRAVPFVTARLPAAKFVCVGGNAEEIQDLSRLSREVGAEADLLLLPMRPQSEMPAFMAACDVLVSPRVRGINPPGKLFSYLNSGRPVVATNSMVHTQLLDPRCAILTPPDPEGLAGGILTALLDDARREEVVRGATEILRSEYSDERRQTAYRELLALLEPAPVSRGRHDRARRGRGRGAPHPEKVVH